MAHIPVGSKWYLADIVEEFQIESEPRNVIHINTVLVRADSPEEAYERAMALGRESDMAYTNSDGRAVRAIFRGLRDLNVVYGELEHGTELIYEKRTGMSESELARLISREGRLSYL